MRCLRLENHEFSGFFLWGQLYRLEDAKRNVLDLTEFRNHIDYSKLLRDQAINLSRRTFYTGFGSGQLPVSLEITNNCVPDPGNVAHHTKKVTGTGVDLSIKYLLRLILYGFLLPIRHLLLLIKIVFKPTTFQIGGLESPMIKTPVW